MTDRIGQLAFSSFRFLFCFLAVFSGVVPLWVSDGPDDDMKETEEEACGPLQIKSQTELCSADYYIKGRSVTAQDSCDMRDRLLRYFATCCQEKPLSGSLKRG